MTVLMKLGCLALAGALGTLCRYSLGEVAQRIWGAAFPWGTLVVNALGCLLFGMIWPLAEERLLVHAETRAILLVGFAGAFTTYSTFAFETSEMLRESQYAFAAANILGQTALGLLCVFAGLALGRML